MGSSIACATGAATGAMAMLTCGALAGRAWLTGKRTAASGMGLKPCKKILYLVRHGEADHNVAEKATRRVSKRYAEVNDIDEQSDAFKEMAEKERKKVLKSNEFKDAKLSNAGVEQATTAQRIVSELEGQGLPSPTVVYVSPLQRTLKTAQVIFKEHPNVRVREELRERITGLPCDTPSSRELMQKRVSFLDFKWDDDAPKRWKSSNSFRGDDDVEDKLQLRERTTWALDSLLENEDESIGIVSHKGFLRELEKGPLKMKDATEFDNCEVRVYEVTRDADGCYEASCLHPNGCKD